MTGIKFRWWGVSLVVGVLPDGGGGLKVSGFRQAGAGRVLKMFHSNHLDQQEHCLIVPLQKKKSWTL